MLRNNSVWNRNQTKKKFNPVLFVKFQGIRSQVRWPERPETLAHTMLLKQNRLHWLAQNYHSEDAAICYFQSASQQRGMKRAESQREQRLSFIRWKRQPLTEERVLFATSTDKTISLYIFVAYISQLPVVFNTFSEKDATDVCFSLSTHLNIIFVGIMALSAIFLRLPSFQTRLRQIAHVHIWESNLSQKQ